MTGQFGHTDLVADLRTLREKGLMRLRTLPVRSLFDAAERCGLGTGPAAVETLLQEALDALGGGRLGEAAGYTFGLLPGTRDWPAQDRRKRGAESYRVSVDRFRKHYERLVIDQVADAILRLCEQGTPTAGPAAEAELEPHHVVTVPLGAGKARITVHTCSVELLSEIDIIVSSANTYLELAHTFNTSLSAGLRRAASRKGPTGEIIDDTMARELAAWIAEYGRTGLSVAPGTVAATGPGELAQRGIRRVYHAAVAAPRSGTNSYDVDPATISLAVTNAFKLARSERATLPDLRSICLPLFGAGRGGMPEEESFAWIWTALEAELAHDPDWEVHFVARYPGTARTIVAGLTAHGGH
jgi:O-acetyl-ADP-ribose deacetylase (regulator of RNase III)